MLACALHVHRMGALSGVHPDVLARECMSSMLSLTLPVLASVRTWHRPTLPFLHGACAEAQARAAAARERAEVAEAVNSRLVLYVEPGVGHAESPGMVRHGCTCLELPVMLHVTSCCIPVWVAARISGALQGSGCIPGPAGRKKLTLPHTAVAMLRRTRLSASSWIGVCGGVGGLGGTLFATWLWGLADMRCAAAVVACLQHACKTGAPA